MFDLAIAAGIGRLTFRRPEARNAIPATGWSALAALLVEAAGARVLVLRGEGSAFCAGADLADFEAMAGDEAARSRFRTAMGDAVEALAGLPIPTIAAIDGPCFGAGVALAMACDLRVAGPGARFAITPAKYGISYPQEDIFRLVSLVGPGQAARLLLSADSIDGREAARIGLVELCADPLDDAVEALAAQIAAGSGASHRALKMGIALARGGRGSDGEQDRIFDALLGSPELAEKLRRRRAAK